VSYDLILFRLPEGGDPERRYTELMEQEERDAANLDEWKKRPVPAAVRVRMEALAHRLTSELPTLKQFAPASPLPWIELNEEELLVQVAIEERKVSINLHFGERGDETEALAARCCDIVQAELGYVAYDPQRGRLVTEARDGATAARGKPWWKFW
jgi:hypothetical protein